MKTIRKFVCNLFIVFLTACNFASSTPLSPAKENPTSSLPQPNSTEPPSLTGSADIIFSNGMILTMDDGNPSAEAIAIQGNKILEVGTNAEVFKQQGPATLMIDLEERTLVPGFIDTHQHRIINGPGAFGYGSPAPFLQAALEQGLTTIDELYTDESHLDTLRALDQAGELPLRVNAYLPVNENSDVGRLFDPYYETYTPGQMVSPHVRVAGLKVFTDFNNATVLLWKQADLNAFLLKEHQKGWQLAVKTVSTHSMEMIVKAFEYIESVDPGVLGRRGRLEHALFISPNQIARIKHLGLIPVINFNNPGQLVGISDIDAFIAREPQASYTPWSSLVQAGIPIASCSGFPSLYADEPTGAPFGSPIHLVYQAVTRVGNLGTQPEPWMMSEAITAEDALRALTIGGAYANFQDDTVGSLTPGKLADMVILSDNPLSVSVPEINNIKVLMTMIDGKVEFCSAGFAALCPSAAIESVPTISTARPISNSINLTSQATISASAFLPESPAAYAIDGDIETIWNSGSGPRQWIRFEFAVPRSISAIRLTVSQFPAGYSVHRVWDGDTEDTVQMLYEFGGNTQDGQILEIQFPAPIENVRILYVITTESSSWVAWREIEVIGE